MGRVVKLVSLFAVVHLLVACGGMPLKRTNDDLADRRAVVEYLNKVDREAEENDTPEVAVEKYRAVAKQFEENEEPWVRLSKRAFDKQDYAAAANYSKEALARDDQNTVAASVLAASGLRISFEGLEVLRAKKSQLDGSAKEQAESVVKLLKDVLGTQGLLSNDFQPTPVYSTVPTTPIYVEPAPVIIEPAPPVYVEPKPAKIKKPRKKRRRTTIRKKARNSKKSPKAAVKTAPVKKPKKATGNPFERLQ